jgi:hypothetical protein
MPPGRARLLRAWPTSQAWHYGPFSGPGQPKKHGRNKGQTSSEPAVIKIPHSLVDKMINTYMLANMSMRCKIPYNLLYDHLDDLRVKYLFNDRVIGYFDGRVVFYFVRAWMVSSDHLRDNWRGCACIVESKKQLEEFLLSSVLPLFQIIRHFGFLRIHSFCYALKYILCLDS